MTNNDYFVSTDYRLRKSQERGMAEKRSGGILTSGN